MWLKDHPPKLDAFVTVRSIKLMMIFLYVYISLVSFYDIIFHLLSV